MLRFALQKSGRLKEGSFELIREMGVRLPSNEDLLRYQSSNFPIEFLFLRDDDIPGYVADGVADIGIVGENIIAEKSPQVEVVKKLGFAKCRLSIAVPKTSTANCLKDLNGQKIATSYPNTLEKYAKEQAVNLDIQVIGGSTEIAPAIDLAPAICDLVSSGSTLMQNSLKEIEVVLQSQAVLVTNSDLTEDKQKILTNFLFRLEAVQAAEDTKYIILNAPKEKIAAITELLPGVKNPTISPLADPGWVSFSSVVKEKQFWDALEKVKDLGSRDILVMPIEKMIV